MRNFSKTKKELKIIEHACKITDDIFKEIIDDFNFKTEKELSLFIKRKIRAKKCKLAFTPIVASGKNASNPHHKPTDSKLKGFVVIDFGVKYKEYCSDLSRTVFVGNPKKKEIDLYNLVLNVQNISIKKVKIGLKCDELNDFSRKKLGKHKKYFIHGLGHGLGKKIHENPPIGKKQGFIMQKNMAFTIEPGIYIKGKLGIRIEDTLILENKAKRLTTSSKKLFVFK